MQALVFSILLSLSQGRAPIAETPSFKVLEIPACTATTGNPYAVCKYGTRSEIVAGEQKITPLYAVVSKNTNHAEQLSTEWMTHFGTYALDAEVYVRPEEGNEEAWQVTAYWRPKNIDEEIAWHNDHTLFSREISGDKSILPSVIRVLPEGELAKIWYFVRYLDGSAKLYLRPGTSAGKASDFVRSLLNPQ